MAPTRAITYGAFSPRAMSSPSLRLRRGPQDPGAATPSRSPPRGPFVLPQDRPPRRPRGSAASDASADADPGEQWCGWMCRLCTYKEAPEWSVHNKYIHTGYRTGFGWRAAVRSVRVPPDPAPARSLSSLRRASTSRSRVSPSPSVFGIVPSAPGVPASPSRALVSTPPAPPLTLVRAPSPPRSLARRCSWCTTRRVTFGPISSALPSSSPSPSPWPPDGARTTCPHSRTRGSPARTPRALRSSRGPSDSDSASRAPAPPSPTSRRSCETDPISSSGPTRIRTRDPSTASETKTTAAIVAR